MEQSETPGNNGNGRGGGNGEQKPDPQPPPQFIEQKPKTKTGKPRRGRFTMRLAEKIYFLAGFGLTDKQIAWIVDINEDTLNRWKQNAQFRRRLVKAKENADREVEHAILKRAKGMTVIEKVVERVSGGRDDGRMKQTVIEKEIPPDPQSGRLWLTNRSPERWSDKPIHIAGDVTVFNADKMAINMAEQIGDRNIAIQISDSIIRALGVTGKGTTAGAQPDLGDKPSPDGSV